METPESCLEMAVEAIGSMKVAGHMLRPEMAPGDAGKWLARCLRDGHKQRLNYKQEALLYRRACESGQHEGFAAYAASIGYRVEPIDRSAEIIALTSRAEQRAREAGELTEQAKALMAHAGLKVEA